MFTENIGFCRQKMRYMVKHVIKEDQVDQGSQGIASSIFYIDDVFEKISLANKKYVLRNVYLFNACCFQPNYPR